MYYVPVLLPVSLSGKTGNPPSNRKKSFATFNLFAVGALIKLANKYFFGFFISKEKR